MTDAGEDDGRAGLSLWAQQARVRSAACTAHAARAVSSAEVLKEQTDRMIERLAERNPESAEHVRTIRLTAAGRRAAIAALKRSYAAGRAGLPSLVQPLKAESAMIAELENYLREVAAIQERGRIADGVQAAVTQRVFAVGLALQRAAELIAQPEARARLEEAADGLDEVIRIIRDAMFGRHQ